MSLRFHWMHRNSCGNSSDELVAMAKELESANITSVLLPSGPTGADFSIHLPKILEQTDKIRVMLALSAYSIVPEHALKTFITIQPFGPGRVDLNLVAGNYDSNVEKSVLDNYPGNKTLIDSHEKRVALTEVWMEKFSKLLKLENFRTRLYVVGSSDTTIRTANLYTGHIILNDNRLDDNIIQKITNSKIVLVIDPLIINEGEDIRKIEYHDYQYSKGQKHSLVGTYEEVTEKIKDISKRYNIYDFMIHSDQKDISKLLKMTKDLSK